MGDEKRIAKKEDHLQYSRCLLESDAPESTCEEGTMFPLTSQPRPDNGHAMDLPRQELERDISTLAVIFRSCYHGHPADLNNFALR